MLRISLILAFVLSLFPKGFDFFDDEISLPKSPEEELKTFQLADGFDIKLVAAEPLLEDPVLAKFDEKGRLWVVEMRAFMNDIDGSNEDSPIGRVSYLEDKDGDGKFDKRTTYADNLILPRGIQFFPDGVLIAENIPLWFYEDTDGDGVSDKRTLVDAEYGGGGLPEHSANGLILGDDGWIYNAKSKYRYKRNGKEWLKEETEFRGQWGIDKDDLGRLYYNYNWSQLHADLVQPNLLNRNPHFEATTGIDHGLTIDRRVFPARPNPAINRGYIPGTLNEEGKLLEFTSACSPFVQRSRGVFPDNLYNSVFVCEPAGNLVKLNLVNSNGNYLEAKNAFNGKEFLASTDERFRPVHITSGPDGAIYIVDMYRGINQHGAYMTEYLREQTLKRGLDKYVHLGRIWKITPKNFQALSKAELSTNDPKGLVEQLESPFQWAREHSKRLLIQNKLTQDLPELEKVALHAEPYAQLGALTVMENLGVLNPSLTLQLLSNDDNEDVKARALALASRHDNINKSELKIGLTKVLSGRISDALALQMLLSSDQFEKDVAFRAIAQIISNQGEDALLRDAALSASGNRELDLIDYLITQPSWQKNTDHQNIFFDQLGAIILKRRIPEEVNKLLNMIGQKDNWQTQALLTGMASEAMSSEEEPLTLTFKPQLLEQGTLETERLSKALHWPEKPVEQTQEKSSFVLDAEGLKQYSAGRKAYLTYCTGCHGANGKGVKRFAPPLSGSEWVTGDESRLALILLHGLEGPLTVKGTHYDVPDILPVMPSHSTLNDEDIANIMTYIRNEWGHSAAPVTRRTVGMLRVRSQGKVQPWTARELITHTEKLNEQK
ncbi:DUF7133 domain-containing protein [Jiulongibacter sediminis]|uniref:DUF7133 domain-containing protein n=1 Tax=Jiulongibacter sediminis TaxID=1605367 RepID=UPI0006DCBFF9|nr:c-type cytochrome [Jiulongibacter sediminis]TBX26395.1 hypothetical protein TK44_01610 [Jiulongibacter sediminis]